MRTTGEMIHRNIAGDDVLIPVGETAMKVHGLITVTETGLMIWEKLHNECLLNDLVDMILKEYDIDEETATRDVREFLEKLDRIGILEKGEND